MPCFTDYNHSVLCLCFLISVAFYLSFKYLERNPPYQLQSGKHRLQVWLPPLGSSEKAAARIQMDGLEMALNGCLINHLQFENNTITRLAGLTSTRSHHPVETVAGVAKQDAGTLITTSATTAVSSLQYSMKSSKIRRQLYRENLCSMM